MEFAQSIEIEPMPFTMERVRDYGVITNDLNPLHVSAEFAAKTRFGQPIVHGLMVLAPVWESFEREFGAERMAGARTEIKFIAPTFVGSAPVYSAQLESIGIDGARYMVEIADAAGAVAVKTSFTVPAPAG